MTVTKSTRLSIAEHIYFNQGPDFEMFGFTHRFTAKDTAEEQAFQRRYKIGTDWESLQCGWITEAKYLWIENHGAGRLQLNPSEEESAARANRVTEITFRDEVDLVVYPGESVRISPFNLSLMKIRVRDEPTFITVTLIQR